LAGDSLEIKVLDHWIVLKPVILAL
jgi:hypothetical protein